MNDRISQLYLEMLWELKARLDEADRIFVRMSNLIVASMSGTSFPAAKKKTLLELDEKYRTLMCKTVEDVARIYPGKIALFPLQGGGSLIENMEKRNAQSEELARIINELFAANGQNITERINFNHQSWRSLMENVDFKAEFEKKFAEEEKFSKRPNILVAGYTGCGKTSLIRTVLGPEAVPLSGIDNGKPCRMDFDCYENESIRLWDSRGLELDDTEAGFRDRMKDFVAERQDDISVDEHIHLVWYLIQGNTARVTSCDLALMKEIFTFDNVIAVISKKDITKPEQTVEIRQALAEGGVPEHRIIEVSDVESGAVGCRELVALSCNMLPAAYRDAFMAAQSIDREAKAEKIAEKKDTAREIIQQGCKTAEKIATTPVTVKDCAILTAPQIEMTAKLAFLYGLRDKKVREDIATFVQHVVEDFAAGIADSENNPESGITADTASVLTGAIGHYLKNSFEVYAIAKVKGTPLPGLGFDLELFKTFYQTYNHGMNMKPNILVCGKTGVGKTSLIQAVTHRGVVPDSAIGNGKATTEGFQIYETEIANFIDSEGMNPGSQSVDEYADFILGEVFGRLESNDKDNLIHNIWYCIDGSGARIQDADAKIIKTFSDKVILVVTKCELMRKEQTESVMNTLLDLIDRDRIVLVSAENKTGLNQLIAKAQSMSGKAMEGAEEELDAFRDRWDDYYANMRNVWTENVSGDADSYINWAAGRAAAIALIPLPLADVAPLIANEVYMLYKLAGVYGIAVDNTVITMLMGCAGGSIVGKIGASFLPFLKVPIAAGVTYGVGKAAKAYFESDMTLDIASLKEKFLEGEREAKKREWKPVDEEK